MRTLIVIIASLLISACGNEVAKPPKYVPPLPSNLTIETGNMPLIESEVLVYQVDERLNQIGTQLDKGLTNSQGQYTFSSNVDHGYILIRIGSKGSYIEPASNKEIALRPNDSLEVIVKFDPTKDDSVVVTGFSQIISSRARCLVNNKAVDAKEALLQSELQLNAAFGAELLTENPVLARESLFDTNLTNFYGLLHGAVSQFMMDRAEIDKTEIHGVYYRSIDFFSKMNSDVKDDVECKLDGVLTSDAYIDELNFADYRITAQTYRSDLARGLVKYIQNQGNELVSTEVQLPQLAVLKKADRNDLFSEEVQQNYDTSLPELNLILPTQDVYFEAVEINSAIEDESPIDRVEVSIDGVIIDSLTEIEFSKYELDLTQLENGEHLLEVTVFDQFDLFTKYQKSILIWNDKPSLTLNSESNIANEDYLLDLTITSPLKPFTVLINQLPVEIENNQILANLKLDAGENSVEVQVTDSNNSTTVEHYDLFADIPTRVLVTPTIHQLSPNAMLFAFQVDSSLKKVGQPIAQSTLNESNKFELNINLPNQALMLELSNPNENANLEYDQTLKLVYYQQSESSHFNIDPFDHIQTAYNQCNRIGAIQLTQNQITNFLNLDLSLVDVNKPSLEELTSFEHLKIIQQSLDFLMHDNNSDYLPLINEPTQMFYAMAYQDIINDQACLLDGKNDGGVTLKLGNHALNEDFYTYHLARAKAEFLRSEQNSSSFGINDLLPELERLANYRDNDLFGTKAARQLDDLGPEINISLVENEYIQGTVEIPFTAKDFSSVDSLSLLIDDQPITATLENDSFKNIDTSLVSDGIHTFTVIAKDTYQNESQTNIQLQVFNAGAAINLISNKKTNSENYEAVFNILSISDSGLITINGEEVSFNNSQATKNITLSNEGINVINVSYIDEFSNVIENNYEVVLDSQGPEFTSLIPADQQVTYSTGLSSVERIVGDLVFDGRQPFYFNNRMMEESNSVFDPLFTLNQGTPIIYGSITDEQSKIRRAEISFQSPFHSFSNRPFELLPIGEIVIPFTDNYFGEGVITNTPGLQTIILHLYDELENETQFYFDFNIHYFSEANETVQFREMFNLGNLSIEELYFTRNESFDLFQYSIDSTFQEDLILSGKIDTKVPLTISYLEGIKHNYAYESYTRTFTLPCDTIILDDIEDIIPLDSDLLPEMKESISSFPNFATEVVTPDYYEQNPNDSGLRDFQVRVDFDLDYCTHRELISKTIPASQAIPGSQHQVTLEYDEITRNITTYRPVEGFPQTDIVTYQKLGLADTEVRIETPSMTASQEASILLPSHSRAELISSLRLDQDTIDLAPCEWTYELSNCIDSIQLDIPTQIDGYVAPYILNNESPMQSHFNLGNGTLTRVISRQNP